MGAVQVAGAGVPLPPPRKRRDKSADAGGITVSTPEGDEANHLDMPTKKSRREKRREKRKQQEEEMKELEVDEEYIKSCEIDDGVDDFADEMGLDDLFNVTVKDPSKQLMLPE